MRISGIANTAATPADDDYIAIDGTTNGTRKFGFFSWLASHYFGKTEIVPVANGGTGASTASDARANLSAAGIDNGKVLPEQASSRIITVTESKTLAPSDSGSCQKCINASDITITLPTSAGFQPGTEIEIARYGAGAVTFAGDTGVSVCCASAGSSIKYRYTVAVVKLMDTNEWLLNGDLE